MYGSTDRLGADSFFLSVFPYSRDTFVKVASVLNPTKMLGFSLLSPGFDGVGKERTGPFRPNNNKISKNLTMVYGRMALSGKLGVIR